MDTSPTKSEHIALKRGTQALEAKLWPNGEVVIWRSRKFKPEPLCKRENRHKAQRAIAILHLMLSPDIDWPKMALALGLSHLPIFDRGERGSEDPPPEEVESRERKGLKGMSSYGRRMVRNAAHLLQEEAGIARCIFATCTVPSLPLEKMVALHQNWHKVVEIYRLGIRRALKQQQLSGEIVTVSEVQAKRHERSGLPILHIHSVFVGVNAFGRFVLTPEIHDDIWFKAIKTIINVDRDECTTACNLQRVRKNASSYIGKYMSKGLVDARAIAAGGKADWLPKHWWNCTRSLSRRVKSECRRINEVADWLNASADCTSNEIWVWHREIFLDLGDGRSIAIARFGLLTKEVTKMFREAYR